jgi:predicted nuclease of predicted toxin-antitoxin system
LLIDENLTPDLVRAARSRGFPANHVNDAGLRTASDKAVARYAIRKGLVVVTNNMADFRRIYARRRMHPGLIFLACHEERAFTGANQATLLNAALDDILANDLLQEVVLVRLLSDAGRDIEYELTRREFPPY